MNVLVTGSNGFNSKNLIVGLKNLNCNVVKFDKKNNLEQLKSKIIKSDIRNIGLVGAIELETIPGEPTKRAMNAMVKAFEKGLLIRTTGDIIALSPPLIIEKSEIDQIFETVSSVLKDLD